MRKGMQRSTFGRGLVIALVLIGMLPSATRAADSDVEKHFSIRLTMGLLAAGKAPDAVTDFVVNWRLCQLQPTPFTDCIKPYQDKVGLKTFTDAYDYASVYGYFSVYDGFLKTTGGMTVDLVDGHPRGSRTDPQGKQVRFEFYPAGPDFVDFDYNSDIDHGTGYLYWVTDCMLVGAFHSLQLQDSPGTFNSGIVVARRCSF